MTLFFSLETTAREGFFRRAARRSVKAAVFVEAFANLVVLPLSVELVLVPVLTFVTLLAVFSERDEGYAPVHRVMSGVLSLIGTALFVYVTVSLATDFNEGHTLRALALPVWLSLGSLPFIYGVGLWSAYQQASIRINFATDHPAERRRVRRALLRVAKIRAADVAALYGGSIHDVAAADSPAEARARIRRYLDSVRAERLSDGFDEAEPDPFREAA